MFEAYSVAVRVSLINAVTFGLMDISRSFAKVHGDAAKLQRQLDIIKFKVVGGAVLAGTGLFGLHLLGKTLPYAKEYTRQLALMNTLGMEQADIAKAVGQAWKTSYGVPTTTAAQNLETFRELRSAFGSDSMAQAHAAAMLPIVGRLSGVMQSLTGKPQSHVGFDMVKAIELRTGVMTTEALQRNAELMSRAIIGMGGTISVSDFHGALKMGKISTNKLSDDFTYNYLPTLMQELKTAHGGGAQSAGTILMSLYQQMHGRMTKAAMPLWVQSGLVRPQDVVKTSTGQYQVKPGAVAGTELFEQNPFLWVQNYLRPAVDRLAAAKHISPETAVNAMFSNRNAAFGAYNMLVKGQQYERDKTTIMKADGGYAAYQKLLKTDPTLASQALHAQWQNVLAQIGYSIMPTLIRGTLLLVKGLQALSHAMREHPGLTKALVIGFAALSASLAFGGMVLLLSAAFSGLALAWGVFTGGVVVFGTVMTTVGAVIGGLLGPIALCIAVLGGIGVALYEIVKHWDASKGILANIKAELGMFFNWLAGVVRVFIPDFGKGSAPVTHRNAAPQPSTYGAHGRRVTQGIAAPVGHSNRPAPTGSAYVVPRPANSDVHVHTKVNLDGRTIAEVVSKHQARDINHTMLGSGRYDHTASLPPAAAGFSRA